MLTLKPVSRAYTAALVAADGTALLTLPTYGDTERAARLRASDRMRSALGALRYTHALATGHRLTTVLLDARRATA